MAGTMRKLRHDEIPRISSQESAQKQRHPICAVIDDVRSIHNVGSFFRTSDGAWIEKMYLAGITGTPENRALHKTALGAQDTIPWEYVPDAAGVVSCLKASGYTVYALEISNAPTLYHDLDLDDFPLALVVGNELSGVSAEVMALVDGTLEIPQYGTKQSLNVSVAYGIAVFDLVRHYRRLSGLQFLDDAFARPGSQAEANTYTTRA
jgi:tRNA G18 (ribose-2'-O)-methylase SpoU